MELQDNGYRHNEPANPVEGNKDDPIMIRAMRVNKEGDSLFNERRDDLVEILTMLKATNAIKNFDDSGTFMYGRLASNALDSHLEKEDFLNWNLKAVEPDNQTEIDKAFQEYALEIGKKLLQETLDNAGMDKAFKGKNGVRRERAIKGDAFIFAKKAENNNFKLKNIKLSEIKLPKNTKEWEDVKELVLLFNYDDYDDFIGDFKDNEKAKNISWGMLSSDDQDEREEESDERRPGQAGLYLNWEEEGREEAIYFAGPNLSILDEFKGDNFPFRDKDDNPTNPVFHQLFTYGYDGFWNYGLMDPFYQLNSLDEWNMNNKVLAERKATQVYNMLNVPMGKKNDAELAILEAEEQRMDGKTAWIVNEVDQAGGTISNLQEIGGGASGIGSTSYIDNILTEKTTAEGISTTDVQAEKGKPLGSFEIEQENANRKAREVGEINAAEFKRMLEYFFHLVVTYGNENDERVLDMTDVIVNDKPVENVTIGVAIKLMKEFRPFITVDALSGTIPNATIEFNKWAKLLNIAAGTPKDPLIRAKMLELGGIHSTPEQATPNPESQVEAPENLSEKPLV